MVFANFASFGDGWDAAGCGSAICCAPSYCAAAIDGVGIGDVGMKS
jgi:hypothetical protein